MIRTYYRKMSTENVQYATNRTTQCCVSDWGQLGMARYNPGHTFIYVHPVIGF